MSDPFEPDHVAQLREIIALLTEIRDRLLVPDRLGSRPSPRVEVEPEMGRREPGDTAVFFGPPPTR